MSAAAPFAITVKAEDEPTENTAYVVVPYNTSRQQLMAEGYNGTWSTDSNDLRAVMLGSDTENGTNNHIYFVTTESGKALGLGTNGNGFATNVRSKKIVDNITYYYYVAESPLANSTIAVMTTYLAVWGTIDDTPDIETAIYYTFGEGSILPDPEPEVELLGLKNLRYNTRLVGHGTQGYQNIDEITWDPGRDLGENFLVGGTVQIRAVSGKYAALTYDGLKALSIGDFSFVGNPVVLASDIVATVGSFSVTWQTVFNSLSLTALNIKAYQDAAGYWNREGWVYQYRYKLDNSTTTTDYSDWFTVYSFTSASGDSTVGLDNNLVAQPGSDGLYNNVVDSFNDINTINADIANNYNTNNYYYIDNNQYLINPDTTQQNTDQQSTWDQFTYKFHEYHDSEDLLINDMNNAIEDLTPSADLNSNNNFLNAANWVKVQFDRMTLNTPMELIIIFSLTLGFGLLLIGRFK